MDKEKAKQSSWIRRGFIKELDHRLRSPLNTILGITELCGESATDQAICCHLESVREASRRLLGRIDDLMLLLKLKAAPLDEKSTGFCLEDVLEEALVSGLSLPGCHASDLSLDIGPDVPSLLMGAEKAFRLAFERIFGFWCGFFSENPVRIDVFFDDSPAPDQTMHRSLTVRVSSATGAMVDGDAAEGPFPRFSFARFSISGSPGTVDCGFDLAIAGTAIEGAGGRMEVFNKESGGFVISILFPVELQEDVEDTSIQSGSFAMPVACVVEKRDYQRTLNCRRLSLLGFDTVPVKDEGILWEILEHHPPDLLIMGWESYVACGGSPGQGQQDLSSKTAFLQRERGAPLIITSVPPIKALSMQISNGCGEEEAGPCFLGSPVKSEVLSQAVHSAFYGLGRRREEESKDNDVDLEGLRVLLVEDNEINQAVGLEFLRKKKIRAVVAANGRSVLKVTEKRRFDLILMDIRLPDSDGFSLTRQLRAGGPNARTPIVAMTASTSDRKRCMETGMNDFLTKPVKPEMLYMAIRRWAGRDGI